SGQMLPEYTRSRANGYLDWIGPAIARHADFNKFGVIPSGQLMEDPSKWNINALPISSLTDSVEEVEVEEPSVEVERVDLVDDGLLEKVKQRFNAEYRFNASVSKRSKQTVSELKRLAILEQQAD